MVQFDLKELRCFFVTLASLLDFGFISNVCFLNALSFFTCMKVHVELNKIK